MQSCGNFRVPATWNHLGLNSIQTLHLVAIHFWQVFQSLECQCSNLKNGTFNKHKT